VTKFLTKFPKKRRLSLNFFFEYLKIFDFLGALSCVVCIWECVEILQNSLILWFESARIHGLKYQPGLCLYLGLLAGLIQLALSMGIILQKCKKPKIEYSEGEFL